MGATHAANWSRIPGVELAAAISSKALREPVPLKGNLPGQTHSVDLSHVPRFTTLAEALRSVHCDTVDVCLPTHLHPAIVVEALNAGKHVLVEKPMALTPDECETMIAAARRAGRWLMVAQVLRFWGDYQPLIEAVRSGSLGRLRSLELRRRCSAPAWGAWLHDPVQSGGGAFDLLIHDVDLCVQLLGSPLAVSATGASEFLSAALHYGDVESVTVTGGWHASPDYPFSMAYSARFEAGTLEFSSAGPPVTLYRTDGGVDHPVGGAVDAFEAELSYFAECVRANRSPERCPPAESALAVSLMNRLAESRVLRGKMIECSGK